MKEIQTTNGSKTTSIGDASDNILKSTVDTDLMFITNIISLSIKRITSSQVIYLLSWKKWIHDKQIIKAIIRI